MPAFARMHTRHLHLVAVLIAVSGCSSRTPVLDEFDPAGLTLPSEYESYGDDFEDSETITAEWSAIREGESTEDNCLPGGEGYIWTWADRSTGNVGDPDINLFVCDSGSADRAQQAFPETRLENTVLVVTSSPRPVTTEDLALAADESKLACVRLAGDVQACSAWSSFARYGRYLVTVTFESKLTWDHLSEEEFVRLTAEVDTLVANALVEE